MIKITSVLIALEKKRILKEMGSCKSLPVDFLVALQLWSYLCVNTFNKTLRQWTLHVSGDIGLNRVSSWNILANLKTVVVTLCVNIHFSFRLNNAL